MLDGRERSAIWLIVDLKGYIAESQLTPERAILRMYDMPGTIRDLWSPMGRRTSPPSEQPRRETDKLTNADSRGTSSETSRTRSANTIINVIKIAVREAVERIEKGMWNPTEPSWKKGRFNKNQSWAMPMDANTTQPNPYAWRDGSPGHGYRELICGYCIKRQIGSCTGPSLT